MTSAPAGSLADPVVGRTRRPLDPDARDRLAALAPRVDTGPLAAERVVAAHPALAGVLPEGLARGSTVRTGGQAPLTGALLVAAGASHAGAWVGVAGVPELGIQACAEAGVALERLVAVREPAGAPFTDDVWAQVLGALVDGFDVVVLGAAARVRPGTARRVQARLAHRGAVLVLVGATGPFSSDVELTSRVRWEGLGAGHGHLRTRRLELSVTGRRVRRPREDVVWAPDASGAIRRDVDAPVTGPAAAAPVPLRRTG